MKLLLIGLVAVGFCFGAEPEKTIRPDLLTDAYIPLVIIGEGWSQQIVIQNVDEEEALVGTLKFFTAQGEPWQVDLIGRGRSDTFFVTLLPNQMVVYETTVNFNAQILGYAHIDTDCCPYSLIQTIFRRQEANRPRMIEGPPVTATRLNSAEIKTPKRPKTHKKYRPPRTSSLLPFL